MKLIKTLTVVTCLAAALPTAKAAVSFTGTALSSATNTNPLSISVGQVGIFINNNNNVGWGSFTNLSLSNGLSLFDSATYTPLGTSQSFTFLTNRTVAQVGSAFTLSGAFTADLAGGISQGDEFAVLVFNSSTNTTIAGDTFRIFRGTQAFTNGGWIIPADSASFGYTTNSANFAANVQQVRSTAFLVQTGTVVPEPSTYALLAMGGIALAGYVVRRRRRS
jgi:hypothetical protein